MNDPELIVRLQYLQHMTNNANQVSSQNLNFLLSSQDSRARNFLVHYQSLAFMLEHLSSSFECVQKSTSFYFQESEEEFDYAVATMLQGNYKLAIMGLRSTFELVFLGVVFQNTNTSVIKCNKHTYNITDHIKGLCDTPPHGCVREHLFEDHQFANSDLLSKDKLLDRYRCLSAYVHTKGQAGSRQFRSALPIPTFEPTRLFDIITIFIDTVAILGVILGIKFASLVQASHSGDEYAVSKISLMFSSGVLAQLR